ncbi:MAG: hypothetical protein GKR77_05090, partial [Legionellales bacterium]|nr:hypothetical protein [Legionellales bacterium]
MPLVNINAAYTAQDIDNFITAALGTLRMSDESKHDESNQDDFTNSSPHMITEKIFIENSRFDVTAQSLDVELDDAEPRGQESNLGRYVLLNQQVCRLPASELNPRWFMYVDQTDPNGVQTLWCTLLIKETLPKPASALEHNTIYLAKHDGDESQTEVQFCFKTIEGQVIRGKLEITKFTNPALKEAILTCNRTFEYTRQDVIEVKDLVQYEERIYPKLRQEFIRPVAAQIRHHIEAWIEHRESAVRTAGSSSEPGFDSLGLDHSQAQALKLLWPVQIRQIWYVVEWLVADKLADCRLWVHSPYEESGVWHQDLHTVLQGLQHELSLFERENRRLLEFYTRFGYTSMSALQRPQTVKKSVQRLLSGQSLRQKEYSPLCVHAEIHYGHCVLLSEDTHSSGAAVVEIAQKRCQGDVLERRSAPLPKGAVDLRLKQLAQCDALGLPVASYLRKLPSPDTQLARGLLAREAKVEADLRMDSLAWNATDFQVYLRGAEPPTYVFRALDSYCSSRLVATAAKYGDSLMLKGLVHFGSILTPYHTALLDDQIAQKSQSKDPHHQQTRYQNQLVVLEKLDELLAVVETSSVFLDHQATWKSQNEDPYEQQERYKDQAVIPEALDELLVTAETSSALLDHQAVWTSQNEELDHKQSQQERYENRYQRQVMMTQELDELLVRTETSSLLEMMKKGQLLGKLCQYLFEEDAQVLLTTQVLSAQTLAKLQTSLTILLRYLNGMAQVEKARLQTVRQRGMNESRWDPTPFKQAVCGHLYQLNLLDAKADGIHRAMALSLTVFKRGASYVVLVTNEQLMSWVVSLDELAADGLFLVDNLPWEAFADVCDAQGQQVDNFKRWFVHHCPHTQSSERYTVHLMQSEPQLPEPFAVDVFWECGGYHAIVRNGLQVPERLVLSEAQTYSAKILPWQKQGNYQDVSIPSAKHLAQELAACCSHTDPYDEICQIVADLESFIPVLLANIPMTGQLSWQLEQPTVWLEKNPFERIEGQVNMTTQLRLLPELVEVLREMSLLLRSPKREVSKRELEMAEPLVRLQSSLQDSLGFALLYQMRKVMRQQSTFETDSRYYTMQEDGKFVELNDEGLEVLQKVNATQLKRDLDDVVQLLEDFFYTVPQMSIQMLRDKLQTSRKRCEAKLSRLSLPDEKQFTQEKMLSFVEALQIALEKDRCAQLEVLIDVGRLCVGGLTKFELKEKLMQRQARDYAYLLLSDQRPYSHTWLDREGKNTLFHVLCYFGRCWDFTAQLIETPLRETFESHFSKDDWGYFETIRENCVERDYLGKLVHEGMNEAGLFPHDIGSMLVSPTQEESSQWLLDGLLRGDGHGGLQNRWAALTTWLSVFPARSIFYQTQFGVMAQKEPSYHWVFAAPCVTSNQENLFHYLVNRLTQQSQSARADTHM